MTRVSISPSVLLWAAHRAAKDEEVRLAFPNWDKWLTGEVNPTFKQVERLSQMTVTPLGFLFLDKPPIEHLPIPFYRTLDGAQTQNPSPNLLDTLYTLERRQEWMRSYFASNGYDRLEFIGAADSLGTFKNVASDMREKVGLTHGWGAACHTWQEAQQKLIEKIEELRITVVINGIVGNNTHRKLNVKEFRGFALVDDLAPIIFINGADGKAAQMFTLAHELAHLWYGQSAVFDLETLQPAQVAIETTCNAVAAEFLVPEAEFRSQWRLVNEASEPFQAIAKYFKVSEIVAARRALDIGVIGKGDFFEYFNSRNEAEKTQSSEDDGGNFYATQPNRVGRNFARTVFRALKEGRMLYTDAYRLTGLRGKTFSEFATYMGFRGDL
ncbi:MAG: ImmA/IrrE family metallo-endopeptidase [Sulfobacillus sp.]